MNNKTPILTVYNDGTFEIHPGLTAGVVLQIADNLRATVLNLPIAPRPNGNAPETRPIEAPIAA